MSWMRGTEGGGVWWGVMEGAEGRGWTKVAIAGNNKTVTPLQTLSTVFVTLQVQNLSTRQTLSGSLRGPSIYNDLKSIIGKVV